MIVPSESNESEDNNNLVPRVDQSISENNSEEEGSVNNDSFQM
jgi:hypothetical protein